MVPRAIEMNVEDVLSTHYDVSGTVHYKHQLSQTEHALRIYDASSEIDVSQMFVHASDCVLTTVKFFHWYNEAYIATYLIDQVDEDLPDSQGLVPEQNSELSTMFKGKTSDLVP